MHATFTPHGAPGAPRIAAIDQRLTQLQRELSRATVLLGVGKLHAEGFVAFTTPLRDEQTRLHVERVRLLRNA